MKETGMIFSQEMMKADLAGKKKMTRRTKGLDKINENPDDWELVEYAYTSQGYRWIFNNIKLNNTVYIKCPFGEVKDLIWNRETWASMLIYDKLPPRDIKPNSPIWYKDTDPDELTNCGDDMGKWRSAMFMCRWMSRRSHILTDIRCERVQSITNDDAFNEGMTKQLASQLGLSVSPSEEEFNLTQTRRTFQYLWDSLNGKKYPWNKNCYVWILEWKE
jgi:hypothetical protein